MSQYSVIANWKMNLLQQQALFLTQALKDNSVPSVIQLTICPTATALAKIGEEVSGSKIILGAQDVFWENCGAFTGQISALQLQELGVKKVIIGHSERRGLVGETNQMVHQKVRAALAHGLEPIICVGETFNERQDGRSDYVLIKQVTAALAGLELSEVSRLIIAYEPVWVIGSGQAIAAAEAFHAAKVIRQTLIDLFEIKKAENNFKIIYGGSVDESNVHDFLVDSIIAGFLVGSASLRLESFLQLLNRIADYTQMNKKLTTL